MVNATEIKKKRGAQKGFHPVMEWKPGQSGNPHGTPRKGMSVAEIRRSVSAMTPAEMRQVLDDAGGCKKLDAALKTMPQNMPYRVIREIMIRVANMEEPTASLLSLELEREEGKVADNQKHSGEVTLKVIYEK